MIGVEDLAELSPNMCKVLRECDGFFVLPSKTYWMVVQSLLWRGLLERPNDRKAPHPLTEIGQQYREALLSAT